MKCSKIILYAVCTFVAVVAVITAIVIFRNEIACVLSDIKEKIDEKKLFGRNGEFAAYADV